MKFQSNNFSSLARASILLPFISYPSMIQTKCRLLRCAQKKIYFSNVFAIYIWMPQHSNVCMFVFIIIYTSTIKTDILYFNVCIFVRILYKDMNHFYLKTYWSYNSVFKCMQISLNYKLVWFMGSNASANH